MNREAIDRWCERGILGLVLAILVFGPLALGAVTAPAFLVIQALTLGVIALWIARFWLSPNSRLLWPPICWAVLAFTLYAIARYLTADIEYVARQELIRILVYAFLFFAILNNLRRQESNQIVSFTLLFLAMAISVYAIFQYATGSQRVWQYLTPYKHRGTGTYICPNHLAGFLEMLLPLGLAYTLVGRLKPVTKVFIGYAALVILAGIAVSLSRGGWISTLLALLVLFGSLLFHRNYWLPAALFLLALVAAGAFIIPNSSTFQLRVDQLRSAQADPADDSRMALWRPAVQMWQENVWFGIGPAHFDERFRVYRPESVQLTAYRAHNDYLNTLADWGIIGTTLVAAAWGLLGWGILRNWRAFRGGATDLGGPSRSNKFAFALGASLGLLAILCHSLVDFNMHIPANAILAMTLMALLSAHLRFATNRYWVSVKPWSRLLASALLLGGLVYLGQQGWRHSVESARLYQAGRQPPFSAERIKLLEMAFAAEPMNGDTAYAIGQSLEQVSREGGESYDDFPGENYRQLAERALGWFDRAMKLNPWHAYSVLHYGMCLDWLGKFDLSAPYFDRGEQLDPNGYFTLDNIGLHYLELGDYAAAKPWFERSIRLESHENAIARNYLELIQNRMMEAATNEIRASLIAPLPPDH
jgi:O-antigen ligase